MGAVGVRWVCTIIQQLSDVVAAPCFWWWCMCSCVNMEVYDSALHEHAAKGRNLGKLPKLTGVRLQGNMTTASRVGNFEDHWKPICGDSAATHILYHETMLHHNDVAAAQFPG